MASWQAHAVEVLPYTASREEWLKARRHGIGASESSAIVGENPYMSHYRVWLDKLGEVPEQEETWAMRRGVALEEQIGEEFARQTGHELERVGLLRSIAWPWMQASLDFRVVGQPWGVECKSTNWTMAKEWADDEIPSSYVIQALHQMAVTGDELTYIPVDLGAVVEFRTVERNDAAIANLVEQCRLFWDAVLERVEPPAAASDLAALKEAIQPVPGKSVVGTAVVLELLRQAKRLRQQIAELKREEESLTAQVKQQIGDAEYVTLLSGDAVASFKSIVRRGYTVKETRIQTLKYTQKGTEYFNG